MSPLLKGMKYKYVFVLIKMLIISEKMTKLWLMKLYISLNIKGAEKSSA